MFKIPDLCSFFNQETSESKETGVMVQQSTSLHVTHLCWSLQFIWLFPNRLLSLIVKVIRSPIRSFVFCPWTFLQITEHSNIIECVSIKSNNPDMIQGAIFQDVISRNQLEIQIIIVEPGYFLIAWVKLIIKIIINISCLRKKLK